jgi:hypothetical protein
VRGCSPELRPYDPRPLGAPLLPFKGRDEEFYRQRQRSAPARDWAALDELDPESAAAETFPRELWRFYDPRERTKFTRVVVACDPNKRETTDGAFASIGCWGLDPAPTKGDDGKPLLGEDGKPKVPVHPWLMHRRREARGRYSYSGITRALQDMLELFHEAKDLVIEHSAHGDSLAGDDAFLQWLLRRNITLWLAQPNGGFAKVKREGGRWVPEKVGDPAALAGGKEDWWPRLEAPLREGHLLLPAREHGRDTCDWVRDREDGADDGERQGFITEFARAHRDGVVDRVDETAILVAWARAHASVLTKWKFAG